MCDRKSCDCSVVRDLGSGPWAERRSLDHRMNGSRPPAGESMPRLPHYDSLTHQTAATSEMQGCAAKRVVKPSRRRPLVEYLEQGYRVSERYACKVLEVARATHRYEGRQEQWIELRMRMREIAQTRVRYGYRMIRVLLNREGWKVGKDLVYRLYTEEGLGLRKRPSERRRAVVHRQERFRPNGPNQVWAMDFVSDQLSDGRRFRSLTIVDIYTRESLAIEVGQSLRGEDVVRVLNRLKEQRGLPKMLFCDNGSEFTGQLMDLWAYRNGVKIDFSRSASILNERPWSRLLDS